MGEAAPDPQRRVAGDRPLRLRVMYMDWTAGLSCGGDVYAVLSSAWPGIHKAEVVKRAIYNPRVVRTVEIYNSDAYTVGRNAAALAGRHIRLRPDAGTPGVGSGGGAGRLRSGRVADRKVVGPAQEGSGTGPPAISLVPGVVWSSGWMS